MKQTPSFEKRGCGYRVTFWGAIKDTPGDPRSPWPVEITDTHTDMTVVQVLSVVEARQLAFDILDAALFAEDAVKESRQKVNQEFSVKV